jgi:hypothetical protein
MPDLLKLLSVQLPNPPAAPHKRLPPEALGDVIGNTDGLSGLVQGIPKPPPVRIDDPEGRLSGSYDGELLRRIRDEAKLEGVDPLTALAMAGQETTFGRANSENPFHLDLGRHETPIGPIPAALQYFKKQYDRHMARSGDEELAIQAYNGLGKIQGGSEVPDGTEMYGGQTDLHGYRDRPYGKAIIKLREMLAQQPSIQGLIGKQ